MPITKHTSCQHEKTNKIKMAETSRKDPINTNKTRKSRNEMVRTALGLYLKQKNYVAIDKFRKSDFVLSQTTKQFIFNKMIDEDISRVNSFLYSNVLCLSNNHVTVEHQFNKFVQFVQSQNEPIKSELTNLFGPIICHLYIELLKGREWEPASDFLRNHAHLIAPVENLNAPLPNKVNGCSVNSSYHDDSFPAVTSQILFTNESTQNPIQDQFKDIIQSLSTCLRVEAFESIESIVLFRSSKFVIEISLPAVNVLKNFLDRHGHIIILNILHVWIHFEIKDLKDDNEDSIFVLEEEVEKPILENGIDHHKLEIKKEKESPKIKIEIKSEEDAKSSPEKTSKKTANTYLRRLKHASTKLQKLDTPTRSFNLSDPEKLLASATMDANECHLAAGFDNSIVKIFQLNKSSFRGRNMFEKFKNKVCSWNVNCVESEEFDSSSEEDEKLSVDTETFNTIPSKRARKEQFRNEKYEGNSFDDSGGINLRGHSKGVTDVIFSSHYPILLSTSKDLTVRAWTASNYTCGAVYRGHNYPIWCISESPVGMYFATGSKDLTARLWTTDREFPLTTYVGHTQDIDCIAFHPNGNYLATGSSDLTVRLWSVTSGKLFRVFTECKFPITCIQFSPDGKLLAAAGEEAKVRIFDLAAGSQISELKDHSAPVTSIAWNRTGSKCASVCSDGSVRMWDVTKIGVGDSQSSSSTITCNKLLWHMAGCSRAVRILFNSTDTISCIGGSQ